MNLKVVFYAHADTTKQVSILKRLKEKMPKLHTPVPDCRDDPEMAGGCCLFCGEKSAVGHDCPILAPLWARHEERRLSTDGQPQPGTIEFERMD